MKLQIKDSGAWRNVCSFDQSQEADVLKAGAFLLTAMAPTKTCMRTVDGQIVLLRCESPSYRWMLA